ncbi:hypothetical protein XENOCAPTIV_023357, partial [Xenoophorus captivus]
VKTLVGGFRFGVLKFKDAITRLYFGFPGFRAHYLLGVYSVEDLDNLLGHRLPTLNPSTKWEIRNVSGVRMG